jgi:hypothetical protein
MSAEKIGPISPREVVDAKLKILPDEVFQSFNELIARNYNGGSATVYQSDVVDLMVGRDLDQSEIYKKGWLDVEDIYRKAGWKVEYDKPGYNESYAPYFRFSPKRQNIDE